MKTKTTYEKLTADQAIELGESKRKNCAFKQATGEWLRGELGGINFNGDYQHYFTMKNDEVPRRSFSTCALVVETIEWEVGDLVELIWNGIRGKFLEHTNSGFRIRDSEGYLRTFTLPSSGRLKPWQPGYGYTEDGELIAPPDGWEIVPEGENVNGEYIYFSKAGVWLEGYPVSDFPAALIVLARAYARRIDTIAPETEPRNYRLFKHMEDVHGLTLIDDDLNQIAIAADKCPAITADMIENVLRTLPDYEGDTIDPTSWVFYRDPTVRAKQTADFAAALNEQLKLGAQ